MTEACPLSAEDEKRWRELCESKPAPVQGAPTAEQIADLKRHKVALKEFTASLGPEGQAFVKAAQAARSKAAKAAHKAAKTVPQPGGEPAAAHAKAEAKAKAREKQAALDKARVAAADTREKKLALAEARAAKNDAEHLCSWLQIDLAYFEEDREAVFEIQLPRWLRVNEGYLERLDLEEGKMMLEFEEVEEVLLEGCKELAVLYLGKDAEVDFEWDNLVERAKVGVGPLVGPLVRGQRGADPHRAWILCLQWDVYLPWWPLHDPHRSPRCA